MCRINGILNFKNTTFDSLEATATAMRDTMTYGGPDDAGIFVDQNVALGHRRLSILDLSSAGHQPMLWQNYAIVYNGEIYNFKEIRVELEKQGYIFETNTDTEVILKGFDCWGKDVVKRFRGMFAFAIWDKVEQKLLLCRDRVGVKPLYWYWKEGLFLFASELKAFHKHPNFDKTLNHDAIALYLQQGYIHAPHCVFQYAHKLQGGQFLEIDANQEIKVSTYWDAEEIYQQSELDARSESEIEEELEQILAESFQLRMVADVPVGMFLSGGIDSSLVTSMIQHHSNQQVKTFTIGFHDKERNEAHHAKEVAQHIGTDHTELYCTEKDFLDILPGFNTFYDEPFGDSSGIPTYLVSQLAREQVTVSLSADGGDELFSGYTKYEIARQYFPKIQRIPLQLRKFLAKQDVAWLEQNAAKIPVLKNYKGVGVKLQKLSNALLSKNLVDFFNTSSQFLNQKELATYTPYYIERYTPNKVVAFPNRQLSLMGMIDIKTYLEGDIMMKVDRATMQVALEGREPFLDQNIIEFAQCLPDHLKIKGTQTKYLLRKILYKYVPKELIERPKQGFAIPLDNWLRTHLKDELHSISNDQIFRKRFQLTNKVGETIQDFLQAKRYIPPDFIWYLYNLYQWNKHWL
ncbi:MAG: asparagine synthase (glutamine-hydrolyzing) [Bacteroidota bacterium]